MQRFSTEGLILHAIHFQDYDRILTLYTPDCGLIKAIAPGANRNKKKSPIEPFIQAEFVQEGYNVNITGRHVNITESMKDYALDKISKIERFTDRLIDVNLTMDLQKLDHRVDIVLKSGHLKIKASGISNDMYISIDRAVDRIKEQLLRYKDKLTDHHAKGLPVVDMNVNVIRKPQELELLEVNEEIEDETRRLLERQYRPHEVVSKETRPLKTLSIDEALMKMELSEDTFLVFIHEVDHKLKVIYRRKDGNFGILEPQK